MMNKPTSLYLDFLRVIAAFGVLLVHANLPWFSNNLFLPEQLGHKLVMIFFVLSGYLIAFTVDKKNKGSQKYLVDRLSRLYSVVIPALILTYILDYTGRHFNSIFYSSQFVPDHQVIRYLLNATFLSQVWSLSSKPSSNGPFWSISYEFWYYILFWAGCYLNGRRKLIAIVGICLLVGLKILLLFPVWLFGVIVYHTSKRISLSNKLSEILFVFTAVIIIILTFIWDFSFFSKRFVFGYAPLFFSSRFIFDWIYGALLALNVFCFSFISFSIKIPDFIEKPIKYLSSITFSLYLYHIPMLVFIAAIVPYDKTNYFEVITLLLGLVIIVALLSAITEKQRIHFKYFIEKIFFLKNKKLTPIKLGD